MFNSFRFNTTRFNTPPATVTSLIVIPPKIGQAIVLADADNSISISSDRYALAVDLDHGSGVVIAVDASTTLSADSENLILS
jgi:hypothetical protein